MRNGEDFPCPNKSNNFKFRHNKVTSNKMFPNYLINSTKLPSQSVSKRCYTGRRDLSQITTVALHKNYHSQRGKCLRHTMQLCHL